MKLLEPIKVGNIEFKNRIMFPHLQQDTKKKMDLSANRVFVSMSALQKVVLDTLSLETLLLFQHSLLHQNFTLLNRQKASSGLPMHVINTVQSLESSCSIQTIT